MPDSIPPPVHCSCSRTHCLKLYCDCFKAGQPCSSQCGCVDCLNKVSHPEREHALLRLRMKSKGKMHRVVTPSCCACKNSTCKKKYCSCYRLGKLCSDSCRCVNCHNRMWSFVRLFTSVTMVKREMDCFPHSSVVCVALTLSVKTTILSVCFGISITSLDSASHTNPQCNALPSNSLNAMHFHPIHSMQCISNVYSIPYPTHGILHRRKNDLHITILTTHGSPHQKTQSFTMTDYVKPEQMDTVQKIKYILIGWTIC